MVGIVTGSSSRLRLGHAMLAVLAIASTGIAAAPATAQDTSPRAATPPALGSIVRQGERVGLTTLLDAAGNDAGEGSAAVSVSPIRIGRALDLEGNPIRTSAARATGSVIARKYRWTGAASAPSGFPVRAWGVSSGFGSRWHPILGGSRFHSGIDMPATTGTPISATAAGLVASAGWCGGLGLCAIVDHGGGYTTVYGHMSRIDVQEGQEVGSGQVIGQVGSTGQSTGPHLHYEIRFRDRPLNPKKFL